MSTSAARPIDDAPCGYLLLADDGLVLDVNRSLLHDLGRTREDVVGRLRFVDLLTVGGRIFHETHLVPLLTVEGEVAAVALDLRCADGSRQAVLVNARRRTPSTGGDPVVHVVTVDAGERGRYEKELLRAKQRAEESEARATRLSRSLQASLVPPHPPTIPGLDVAAVYRPAGTGDEVGGDFYDVFEVASGDWVVAVGDVEGKGVEAAAVASLARHVLRAAAVRSDSPSACLRTLNEVLIADRSTRLLTAAVLRLSRTADGWSVTTAAAGHGLPLLLRADGTHVELGVPGVMLGVVAQPRLRDHHGTLAAGDVVVVCTDGVGEARASGGDEFFGDQRVVEITAAHRDSADRLTRALVDEVLAFVGGSAARRRRRRGGGRPALTVRPSDAAGTARAGCRCCTVRPPSRVRPVTRRPRSGGAAMRLNTSLTSNLIAGVIAFVIYLVISLATGASVGSAIGVGLIIGVATFAIAFVITRIIASRGR